MVDKSLEEFTVYATGQIKVIQLSDNEEVPLLVADEEGMPIGWLFIDSYNEGENISFTSTFDESLDSSEMSELHDIMQKIQAEGNR